MPSLCSPLHEMTEMFLGLGHRKKFANRCHDTSAVMLWYWNASLNVAVTGKNMYLCNHGEPSASYCQVFKTSALPKLQQGLQGCA
eukprot:4214122-Amphidinium_carterae.1